MKSVMSNSLDRLAEMVRMAEAKTRAQKLGTETHQAAEALREAEVRAREVEERQRRERPGLLRLSPRLPRTSRSSRI